MNYTRRDWTILLSAAVAASDAMAQKTALASEILRYEDLEVHRNGANGSRPILHGETHTGLPIELHETELAPGEAPHPPHHHAHSEMWLVREGTLEFTVNGKSYRIGPGSAGFAASNDEHGVSNPGATPVTYFVVEVGPTAGA